MSRYSARNKNSNVRIDYGFDRPLSHYFAQVYQELTADNIEKIVEKWKNGEISIFGYGDFSDDIAEDEYPQIGEDFLMIEAETRRDVLNVFEAFSVEMPKEHEQALILDLPF